ncbi:MAG TPA: Nif3-like dinuclear metal center hexameric protein [Desulfurivibrio alkaliphilus]|uniref:GTP cyclohydrolase 1 type 2 homolog n=1 Tax=Desulfurivibrio alkaliphilus TaxID=427923 RepID=A0A7C2TFZ0_9BACT|nr:Nif3-like dinuclear metal center hexameric protein [Desulfurivibrio alkaliphilus]
MTAPLTVDNLLTLLDQISPFSQAEAWDNVGLMVGDPAREVNGILLALDPTEELLAECHAHHCNTLITHHPLIFHPLQNICLNQPQGRLVARAIELRLNIIACHTNLDVIPDGVSGILARRLGIAPGSPIQATGPEAADTGFGRWGRLPAPVPGRSFLDQLAKLLRLESLQVAGPLPETISTVAVCGGSGSDLVRLAAELGADIYISAEIKHAAARWAETRGFCVVDAGHYYSENLVVSQLAATLEQRLATLGQKVPLKISRTQKSPFKAYCYQPSSAE